MTLQFPAAKAAEEFARTIDGDAGQDVADRYAPLAAAVTLLRAQPVPRPRPEFVAQLRSDLMLAADTELMPVDSPARRRAASRPRKWGERHVSAAAAALALVGGTVGVAAASQGALPGDALYPLKRGFESVEVGMNRGDAARGHELLKQAATRLDEVEALLKRDDSADRVTSALAAFSSSADAGSALLFTAYQGGGKDSDVAEVRAFAATQLQRIADLAPLAPPIAEPDFSSAAATIADIDRQARVLCVACSSNAAMKLPDNLLPTSSRLSLDALVSTPTAIAARAARAEQIAAATQGTPSPVQVETPASPYATAGTPTLAAPSGTPQAPREAVGSVIDGLKQGLTTSAPGTAPIIDALQGATDPLKNTTDQITQGLHNTLGGTGISTP